MRRCVCVGIPKFCYFCGCNSDSFVRFVLRDRLPILFFTYKGYVPDVSIPII